MQHLVAEMCTEYFLRYRRQRHVTPKSYLSFLSGYKTTYQTKREELQMLVNRMNTGLKRLVEAAESISKQELAVANKRAKHVNYLLVLIVYSMCNQEQYECVVGRQQSRIVPMSICWC